MISLRKSATELDRLEHLQETTEECYWMALRSAGQYAIELNPADLAEFRRHLELIEQRMKDPSSPEGLRAAQASFRGELREYRERAHQHLAHLKQEIEASVAAMAAFASGVSSTSAEHEEKVRQQLERLNQIAAAQETSGMGEAIRSATREISTSLEQIRRSNQMVIAQLQDEIRLLHEEAEAEKRALYTDPASSAWNRQKMDQRLDELLRQNDAFCMLFLSISNLNVVSRRHSRTVVDGTLKAIIRRMHSIVGPGALIARWTEHQFTAVLDLQPAEAVALSRQIALKLSGSYAVQDNGFAHEIVVQVTTGVIDHPAKSEAGAFRKRVAMMDQALKT